MNERFDTITLALFLVAGFIAAGAIVRNEMTIARCAISFALGVACVVAIVRIWR